METIEEQIEELQLKVAALENTKEIKETEIKKQITNLYTNMTVILSRISYLNYKTKLILNTLGLNDTYQN